MAKLTIADARTLMSRGRPWTFRMEVHDPNTNSHKFWLCTGRARKEPVEVHYGRVGNPSQIIVKDWNYVEQKTPEKIAKGYEYVDTPHVRVQQATIDEFSAPQVTVTAPVTSSPPTPTPTPSGASWRSNPGGVIVVDGPPELKVVFDVFPAPWQGNVFHTFKNDLALLCEKTLGFLPTVWWGNQGSVHTFTVHAHGPQLFAEVVNWIANQTRTVAAGPSDPYSRIVKVSPLGGGHWQALAADGKQVLELTKQGARDIVRGMPHVQVAGF